MPPRINIDITADDQADAELVARLVVANLNDKGFEDVTNTSGPMHIDKEEEVVEAMRNLSPGIFATEVVVDVSTFEEVSVTAEALPGEDEYPLGSDEDADDDAPDNDR